MLSSTERPGKRRVFWYVRARPELGPDPRGQMGHVLPRHLDRPGGRREVARDEVEERRLAGAVRAEDGTALAVRDVEIDVAHGLNAAEAPADPPQAEDRLGVRWCCCGHSRYLMTWVVMTPFLTTLTLPCHGVFSFLHGGCVRPGGGLDGLNRPPNVWSTFGT